MAKKYVALEQLTHYNEKLKETYVEKEFKTGSEDQYKVLSDNNLTDELKTKIEKAGDSSFSGSYSDLTSKPTIDGHEITGTMTNEDLGLATDEELQSLKTELEQKIDSGISAVYRVKGSTLFNALPTPSAENVGDVYNVTDAFVTDDKFNTQSESYPAGTNVVVVDNGGEDYKYDALAGYLDLTDYLQKTDIEDVTNEDIDAMFQE